MGHDLFIRHGLRLTGFLTFVGFCGLWGCVRPPNRTYETPSTLTQPAPETRPGPSDIRSLQSQPSFSRRTLLSFGAGNLFAATVTYEGGVPTPNVTPNITARPERIADPVVAQNIRDAIQAEAGFSSQAKAIQVSAEKGVITLKGNVANQREKVAVALKAQQVAGAAFNVDNQLSVQTP